MKNAAVMSGSADDETVSSRGNADHFPTSTGAPAASHPAAAPPYDQRGAIVVASVWLALYVVMIVSSAISPASRNQQTSNTVQLGAEISRLIESP